MKKAILIILTATICNISPAQFVAKVQMTDSISGICDMNEVYALFPNFTGQVEAICSISKRDILSRLNSEVSFLKDKPKYKDNGMINIIVNCEGEVVQCTTSVKTKDPELDKQILAIFASLTEWTAGKLNGKDVDSSLLFSFKIKKGVITFG